MQKGDKTNNKSEDVAQYLLKEGYLLTALEFYQELIEEGSDTEVLRRRFETDVESANLESTKRRMSRDGDSAMQKELLKEKTEQIYTLEYELKITKETVQELRTELSEALSKVNPNAPANRRDSTIKSIGGEKDPISKVEVKALNYIVRKHLLDNGYKLSAITLEEEASDQDLNDWNAVGLKSSEPPSLVAFYRKFYKVNDKDASIGLQEENMQLRNKLSNLERQHLQVSANYEKLVQDKKSLELKLSQLEHSSDNHHSNGVDSNNNTPNSPSENKGSPSSNNTSPSITSRNASKTAVPNKHKLRRTFVAVAHSIVNSNAANGNDSQRKTVSSPNTDSRVHDVDSYSRITQQLIQFSKMDKVDESVIRVVANCLPHVVPGVILKKREELIPVILSVISRHPDSGVRFKLTELLFNLIKKPNESERKMIVDGFTALASIIGPDRTESELLSQCWNEVNHKHQERRQLVADTCGALAAYVRPELRISLILSILQHLIKDRSAIVREAVSNNLGLLISLLEGTDKFGTVQDMIFELLYDEDDDVRSTTRKIALPIFADWADTNELLFSSLYARVHADMDTIILKPYNIETNGSITAQDDVQRLSVLVGALISIAPRLKETVLLSAPFANQCFANSPAHFSHTSLNEQQEKELKEKFDQFLTSNNVMALIKSSVSGKSNNPSNVLWPELIWLLDDFLPKFTYFITRVDLSVAPITLAFVNAAAAISTTFGKTFTTLVIKKFFEEFLDLKAKEDKLKRARILPTYLVGVVGSLDDKELALSLNELIVRISLEEQGWSRDHTTVLKESVKMLCKSSDRKKEILLLCEQLSKHKAHHIRLTVAILLGGMTPMMNAEEVSKHVIPVCVSLTSDLDRAVRANSIMDLAIIANNAGDDKSILDKLKQVLDPLTEDDSQTMKVDVIKSFSVMIPQASHDFRDSYILPKLTYYAEKNAKNSSTTERREIAKYIFESFRALAGLPIAPEAIISSVLIVLKLLLNESEGFEPSYRSFLNQMMVDMEGALRNTDDNMLQNIQRTSPQGQNQTKAFFDKMKGGFRIHQ